MRIAVARESDAGEPRVGATPETVRKFKALGADIAVARGAGIASGIPDADFEAAGATVGDNRLPRTVHINQVFHQALRVARPFKVRTQTVST